METFKNDCEYCEKAPKEVAVYMLRDAKDGWVAAVSCEKHLQTAKEDCQGNFPKAKFKVSPWKEWKAHVSLDSRRRLLDFGGVADDDGPEWRTLREWRKVYKRIWRELPTKYRKKESFSHWFKQQAEAELSTTGEGEDWRLVPAPRKKK